MLSRGRFWTYFWRASWLGTTLGIVCLCLASCGPGEDQGISPSDSPVVSGARSTSVDRLPESRTLSREKNAQVVSLERPRIVAFGDSLTAGLGVSRDDSYPAQLQERLDEAGYHYRVINAGVSGDTTAGGLRRLDWVLKSRPDIVILELGANDGLRGHSLDETYMNLEQIIRRLQSQQVTILLTGMMIPPNYGLDYTSQFAAMYEQLAEKFDVPLMPFFLEDVAARRELNQADGLHPTGEGYRIIVNNLLPLLMPLLEAGNEANLKPVSRSTSKKLLLELSNSGGIFSLDSRAHEGALICIWRNESRKDLGLFKENIVHAIGQYHRDKEIIHGGDTFIPPTWCVGKSW